MREIHAARANFSFIIVLFFFKASPGSAGDMREILVVEGTARDDGRVVVEEEVEQEIRRGARARHPLQNRR